MSDTKYVKLVKVRELDTALHPNNQPVGKTNYGLFMDKPEFGFGFLLGAVSMQPGQRGYITSSVREVVNDHTFRTWNSEYNWEFIERDAIPGLSHLQNLPEHAGNPV
jgi:hypothetical protein